MNHATIKELINSKKNYVLKAVGVRNYDGLTFGKNYTRYDWEIQDANSCFGNSIFRLGKRAQSFFLTVYGLAC